MTRIDFYVLSSTDPQTRWITACRLTEKAWRLGLKVFLRTADETEEKRLDDLLWTFRQGSFIPHASNSADREYRESVTIVVGTDSYPEQMPDLLINLAPDCPGNLDAVPRLAEVINEDGEVRRLGRLRYRQYKEWGHTLETHQLDPSGTPSSGDADNP